MSIHQPEQVKRTKPSKQQRKLSAALRAAADEIRDYLGEPDARMSNKRREQLMRDESQTRFVATLVTESPAFVPMGTAWLSAAERVLS